MPLLLKPNEAAKPLKKVRDAISLRDGADAGSRRIEGAKGAAPLLTI